MENGEWRMENGTPSMEHWARGMGDAKGKERRVKGKGKGKEGKSMERGRSDAMKIISGFLMI
jgi:hypothetical protein